MTSINAYLRLARISNLPTVWTNVLAASVLSGGTTPIRLFLVMLAASLLYTGGMFLNDAFDQNIDRAERPEDRSRLASFPRWRCGPQALRCSAVAS